ncbi:MAG: hypothetical protein NTW06_02475, partial [Candidatus Falkowbacteria bacterium]|nr:hypothetical protein [Candidatus Falkowbacteria bacterium]
MVKKITFKIYTLGCKVNQYDSNFLAKRLQIYGLKLVKNQADIALVNSCAITKSAITKTRKMITKAKRENPNAKIILFGCWPNVYEIKNKEAGSDKVIISHKFNDLLNIIGKIAGITLHNKSLSVNNLVQNDKARYF